MHAFLRLPILVGSLPPTVTPNIGIKHVAPASTTRLYRLVALRFDLHPDRRDVTVRLQKNFSGRPHDRACGVGKSVLSNPMETPLLRYVRCNTQEPRQARAIPRPLTRGDKVPIGVELHR